MCCNFSLSSGKKYISTYVYVYHNSVLSVRTVNLLALPGLQKLLQRPELLDQVPVSWVDEEKTENHEAYKCFEQYKLCFEKFDLNDTTFYHNIYGTSFF